VSAAHAVGIIHRDLKPENVLLAADERSPGQVKIVDFGLAKLRQVEPNALTSLTMPGMVMGTLNYMSPEQLAGEEVDERGDIFSLGVMAVEAVTGIRPFSGKTCPELLTAIVHGAYHLPRAGREALRLDDVLQKCLAKDRRHRFSTVSELRPS
jgi:serine/threonine-protein kinase